MRKIGSKKRIALVASTVAAVLVGGGVAFAYWSTTGSGTGTAATGTSSAVTITSTAISGLYPGGPAVPIALNVANSNAAAQYVGTVTVAVTGTSNVGCTATDFTVTNGTINAEVPSGATNPYTSTGATIKMIDKPATNQDACKGVTVNLSYTA